MKRCWMAVTILLLFIPIFRSSAVAEIIKVDLQAEVTGVRSFSGSSQIAPISLFSAGTMVFGTFLFDTLAVDEYPDHPNLGYYLNGLTSYSVTIPANGMQWHGNGGIAQIQNDCDYQGNPSPGFDRVLFMSTPSYGLTGSAILGNQLVTNEVDLYEWTVIPPDPVHPLLTSDMPSEGYLLFDRGYLEMQWYDQGALMTTYLDFGPTAAVPLPATAPLLAMALGTMLLFRRKKAERLSC